MTAEAAKLRAGPSWPAVGGDHVKHVVHTGGKYDSYLQVPVAPPKYKAGEYVCR